MIDQTIVATAEESAQEGEAVDLDPLFDAVGAQDYHGAIRAVRAVTEAADIHLGLLARAMAGLRSAATRLDTNTTWASKRRSAPEKGVISDGDHGFSTRLQITGSSLGGDWTTRAWWIQADMEVEVGQWRDLRPLAETPGRLLVGNSEGELTEFTSTRLAGWAFHLAAQWEGLAAMRRLADPCFHPNSPGTEQLFRARMGERTARRAVADNRVDVVDAAREKLDRYPETLVRVEVASLVRWLRRQGKTADVTPAEVEVALWDLPDGLGVLNGRTFRIKGHEQGARTIR